MPSTAERAPSAPPALPILAGTDAFRAWLRGQCNASSVNAVAAGAGIKPAYLSNVLNGRSSIGPSFAARFGYRHRQEVVFEPIAAASPTEKA
jgi:hypothetical protein